jgi:uncharacterized protein YfiM (DUF2279 family)
VAESGAGGGFMGGRQDVKPAVLAIALFICAAAPAAAQSADSSHTPPRAPAHDALFGLDKPKHFVLSAFIESVCFAGLQAAGASHRTAITAGVSSAAIFAVGREIHDRRTKGLFSFGDLLWDALGAGAAAVMLHHTYR